MLIGEYTHTLDSKKRISLPAKFRKDLGGSVVLVPGFEGCLSLYGKKVWQKISANLAEHPEYRKDIRDLRRSFFARAEESEIDGSGRILVPDRLCQSAKLEGRVVVVGMHDRAELWNENFWNEYKKGVEGKAETLAEKLSELGIL